MAWMAKAALAVALLSLFSSQASADDPTGAGQWLKDGDCALYEAGASPGDRVQWMGECIDGFAEGLGTAIFTHESQSQSFTGRFSHGALADGHVITHWGHGWSYDGDVVGGRFNGEGVLVTDRSDRFEGQWRDGTLTGFAILRRADGTRYAGDWKDNKPNGTGELRRADGSIVVGTFVDGALTKTDTALSTAWPIKSADTQAQSHGSQMAKAPFGSISGKTLIAVDGSSIALTLIEGGMELQTNPAEGSVKKTTFTFMTDRMGTVVEDSGIASAGSNVTGFFRLIGDGVEIRYSDGRSAMLSQSPDGGVQMAWDGDRGAYCRAWYPAGHRFSDAEKKMALNAYAASLGLAVAANDIGTGCTRTAQTQSSGVAADAPSSSPSSALSPTSKARHAQAKQGALMAKPSYRIGDYQPTSAPQTEFAAVSVKTSPVHTIDADPFAVSSGGTMGGQASQPTARAADTSDASHCLQVDSDGRHWGFRNSCDVSVQFAYCMAGGRDALTACADHDAVSLSVSGSVAPHGFGALMVDNSLQERDAPHSFRWIACSGGAGEVIARLDRSDPPAGHCEHAQTAAN